MADVDTAFLQKLLNIAQRKRKPNLQHHGQADDLGLRLELWDVGTLCHPEKRDGFPARLNLFWSDRADHKKNANASASTLSMLKTTSS